MTLLTFSLGRVADVNVFDALETHLRSQALSQRRNIFYQDNLETARDYILAYWSELCELEAPERCPDQEIEVHDLYHEFEYGWEDYVPYYEQSDSESSVFPMQYEGKNLIFMVKGTLWGTSADRPLVIGAHYDTFGNSSGTFSIPNFHSRTPSNVCNVSPLRRLMILVCKGKMAVINCGRESMDYYI